MWKIKYYLSLYIYIIIMLANNFMIGRRPQPYVIGYMPPKIPGLVPYMPPMLSRSKSFANLDLKNKSMNATNTIPTVQTASIPTYLARNMMPYNEGYGDINLILKQSGYNTQVAENDKMLMSKKNNNKFNYSPPLEEDVIEDYIPDIDESILPIVGPLSQAEKDRFRKAETIRKRDQKQAKQLGQEAKQLERSRISARQSSGIDWLDSATEYASDADTIPQFSSSGKKLSMSGSSNKSGDISNYFGLISDKVVSPQSGVYSTPTGKKSPTMGELVNEYGY
jgi:hypothetical protein